MAGFLVARAPVKVAKTFNTRQTRSCSLSASAPRAAMNRTAPKTNAVELSSLRSAFSGCSISSNISTVSNSRKMLSVSNQVSYEGGVGIYGHKAGMLSIFDKESGEMIPVTVIAVQEGNIVTAVKTEATDGYNSVQIGYDATLKKRVNKPELGHLEKAGAPPMKLLGEFRLPKEPEGFELGQQLDFAEMFSEGDLVDIRGKTIGKGFQGGIKRWGHARGPMTHGSKSHREKGSFGPGTNPGRILPFMKQAGKMGNKFRKVRKVKVIRVDAENKCLLVKGTLPGKPGNILRIAPAKNIGVNVPNGTQDVNTWEPVSA